MIGDVVLPLDRLDVRVTDETGGGLFDLVARTPLSGGRHAAGRRCTGDGVGVVGLRRRRLMRLDRFGEGTMYLFGGTHQVTSVREA